MNEVVFIRLTLCTEVNYEFASCLVLFAVSCGAHDSDEAAIDEEPVSSTSGEISGLANPGDPLVSGIVKVLEVGPGTGSGVV
jgi:hypothetical protein